MSILRFISFISYQRALYLHLAMLIFLIIPASMLSPPLKNIEEEKAPQINLETLSERDYLKLLSHTSHSKTNINFSSSSKEENSNTVAVNKPSIPQNDQMLELALKPLPTEIDNIPSVTTPSPNIKQEHNLKKDVIAYKIMPALFKKPHSPKKDVKEPEAVKTAILEQRPIKESILDPPPKNKNNHLLPLDDNETAGIFNSNGIVEEGGGIINLSIKDLISVQIKRCWDRYYNDKGIMQKVSVMLIISYDINGGIIGIATEPNPYKNNDLSEAYNIMAQDAKTAVKQCAPLNGMPKKQYAKWSKIRFKFTHKKVS